MSRCICFLAWAAILCVALAGCAAKQQKSLPGGWSYSDRVLDQEVPVSMMLEPDGKMIRYHRLEFQKQPGALDIHGKWQVDTEKQILTITKTAAYWNQQLIEMPQLLGTETGTYRWEENVLIWEREAGGRKDTVRMTKVMEPTPATKGE